MALTDQQHAITSHVVSSIQDAMVARRMSGTAGGADPRAAEQLLAAMRTVKAARFSAAERLERKHALSLFAMSMVSLYFVGLSVWQAVYAPTLGDALLQIFVHRSQLFEQFFVPAFEVVLLLIEFLAVASVELRGPI
jgi:hypothetical protein